MSERAEGAVFAYPFQWNDDRTTDNPKDRTTCLTIRRKATVVDGTTLIHLFLLAISDRPRGHQTAIEIPSEEKRRAGLQLDRPAFIVISEYNYDVLPYSWHYRRDSQDYGRFGDIFTQTVRRAFLQRIRESLAVRNDRTI